MYGIIYSTIAGYCALRTGHIRTRIRVYGCARIYTGTRACLLHACNRHHGACYSRPAALQQAAGRMHAADPVATTALFALDGVASTTVQADTIGHS